MAKYTAAATAPAVADHTQTRRLIAAGLTARIFTNTLTQMFFAFLPILAQGSGTTPIVMGRLLSVRSASGFLTPLFGNLAERRGYRVALPATLLCGTLGIVLLLAASNLPMIAAAMFIMGICITNFQPLLSGYVSAAVSPRRRALSISMIEYGWALSSIFGVYTVGRMLERSGWRVPLIAIGIALAVMAVLFARLLSNQPDADDTPPISLREQLNITENRRGAVAAIAIRCVVSLASLHLYIAYSIWLVAEHGFGAAELAAVVLAFGFVDLAGSGLVSLILNRLGRQRALMLGGIVGCVVFGLLGVSERLDLRTALALLIFGRFLSEFTIVSAIVTVSEQSPSQRSRVMSITGFFNTVSRALAGLTGPLALQLGGMAGLGVPTAIGFLWLAWLARRYIRG